MKKIALLCLFLFMSVAVFASPALAKESRKKDWPSNIVFLTGPKGGQWFALASAIAETLSNTVLPASSRTGGGVANLKNIEEKRGDIGFTLACFMGAADSGEKEYEALRTTGVEIIANVYPQVLYVLVRKDFAEKHKITDARSLFALKAPVRFASLKPGTASEFILSMLLKYGYKTDFAQLKKQGWLIEFNNYAETADNFVAGDLDSFAYTAGTNVPLIKTMEEHLGVVILPVEQKVLTALSAKFKTGTYTIEPGDYQSVKTAIKTLGDYTAMIARSDLPDTLVYDVLQSLYKNKGYIGEDIVDFTTLGPKTAVPANLPLHPGAAKFWKDVAKK